MYKILKKDMKKARDMVNIYMDRYLPRKDEYPKIVHKALRHSLFAGGKGIRSYMLIKIYSIFSDDIQKILPLAAAFEMLHTYSLIHDDLPYLDNDDFRRGKSACHVLFGDGIALLAGDALLIYSFDIIMNLKVADKIKVHILREFTKMAGASGLVGGQFVDIQSQDKKISRKTLKYIHKNKTANFIELTASIACLMAGVDKQQTELLCEYAANVGLSFQIVDDILDIEGTFVQRGKTVGKDMKNNKATYPSFYGLQGSKTKVEKLMSRAKIILRKYPEKTGMLQKFTDFIYLSKW